MRIIQSFWSKPFIELTSTNMHARVKGGWLTENVFYMSCMLSCLKLLEQYGEVHLITDTYGKNLLIEKLKIPYTSSTTDLDNLCSYDSRLWALGKLEAYRLQKSPFIHFDNDVFLYKKLSNDFLESELVIQNFDEDSEYYREAFQIALECLVEMPAELKTFISERDGKKKQVYGCNAGLLGGRNMEFFQIYTQIAFNLVEKLELSVEIENFGMINIFLEQSIFYFLSGHHKINVTPLLETISKDFDEVLRFEILAESKYLHAVGKSKRNIFTNEQVQLRLELEFPTFFKSLKNSINNISYGSLNICNNDKFP